MTLEEAISTIEIAKAECEWNAPLDYQIAFDMAIEALKPKPVSYQDCADAIMMMWMEKIITDSQYNKIMGRLNKWRWSEDDE